MPISYATITYKFTNLCPLPVIPSAYRKKVTYVGFALEL